MIKQLNLTFESYGISSFLYFEVPDERKIDQDQVQFFAHQKVPGLLPLTVLNKDTTFYLRYDCLSDINLAQTFSATLTKKQLISHFYHLVESLANLNESGLSLHHVLLNKDYIFLDPISNNFTFVYIPIDQHDFEQKISLKEFLRELLSTVRYDENDDLQFFIKLHNTLAYEKDMTLEEVMEFLKELSLNEETPEQQETKSNYYSPGQATNDKAVHVKDGILTTEYNSRKTDKHTNKKLEVEEEVQYKRITRTELNREDMLQDGVVSISGTSIHLHPQQEHKVTQLETEVEEGTTVLGAYEEQDFEDGTTSLGTEHSSITQPFLLKNATDEKTPITKDTFTIGRDSNHTDFCIPNKVVGRVHAQIESTNGEYFLKDLNSKNGTYVNGERLRSNGKLKIKHEDILKFGNEEYVFRLF